MKRKDNARRCWLITKKHLEGGLTMDETAELDLLQAQSLRELEVEMKPSLDYITEIAKGLEERLEKRDE